MIPVTVRIFVYREPIDMRRGFDGLAVIARDVMGQDPRSGALFVFANRRADKLKALWWERNGYCLLYKRLHGAVFVLPVPGEDGAGAATVRIDGRQLAQLLAGTERESRVRKRRCHLQLVR